MSLMPQTPFQWFVPATTGTGLVPADGYLVKFYSAGTTTPKTIYTNPSLSVPFAAPGNIAVLDSQGRSLIYLGAGGYKVVVCKPDGTPVYEQDNIAGESSFGTGFVDSYADLAFVNTTIYPYTYIGGYYTHGDGGQGMFYNAISNDAADGGYVQISLIDTAKRWFRISDENGDVRAASFGYCGSGDQTSALLAADAYAASKTATLRIQKDPCTSTTVALNAPTVVFNDGATLYAGAGTNTITINGILEAGAWRVFSPDWDSVTLANASQESRPEWFGASLTADPGDNSAYFTDWKAAGAGTFVVPAGAWPYTGTFTPVSDRITIFLGSVGSHPVGIAYPSTGATITGSTTQTGNQTLIGDFTHTGDTTETGSTTKTGDSEITGDFTVNGTSQFNGTVTSDAQISGATLNATTTVSAGSDITAGQDGVSGFVKARAGSGTQSFKAAGSGVILTTTGSCTLDANSLTATNDYIKIIFAGTTTNSTPTISVTMSTGGGSQTVFSATLSNGSGTAALAYHGEVLVFRTGATTSFSSGFVAYAANSGGISAHADFRSPTLTWANVATISQSASATNVFKLIMYEIYPTT